MLMCKKARDAEKALAESQKEVAALRARLGGVGKEKKRSLFKFAKFAVDFDEELPARKRGRGA